MKTRSFFRWALHYSITTELLPPIPQEECQPILQGANPMESERSNAQSARLVIWKYTTNSNHPQYVRELKSFIDTWIFENQNIFRRPVSTSVVSSIISGMRTIRHQELCVCSIKWSIIIDWVFRRKSGFNAHVDSSLSVTRTCGSTRIRWALRKWMLFL